ncbi:DUF6503 family protein [Cesiribacter andamanensis]|nr:DUF6503 family protein [Cesiribacter andamanensis]
MKISILLLNLGLLLCSLLAGCGRRDDPQRIIDAAIEAHGGSRFNELEMAFDFRKHHYTYQRQGGLFRYTREITDSSGHVLDVLSNAGFTRLINGDTVSLPEERAQAFTNSVNSVHYFAMLPYGLNDAAVQKSYVAETRLKGEPYHLIRVRFAQEGGGVDHEDEFLYWIHTETHTMDYLAYSYQTEGGGMRFREAFNQRELGGIRLQDYRNYKPKGEGVPLDSLGSLWDAGRLELLSEIRLLNVQVTGFQ